jgi:hypothetical protein
MPAYFDFSGDDANGIGWCRVQPAKRTRQARSITCDALARIVGPATNESGSESLHMNRCSSCTLGLLTLLCLPGSLFAQDKGQKGVVVTTPTAVGMIWHASDRIALRPDFSFSTSKSDSANDESDSSTTGVNVGVSALFYVRQWDDLRAYVSPRFSYSRARATVDLNGTRITESTSTVYGIAGALGAQYSLGRRFGVFGEAGLLFSDQRTETETNVVPVPDRNTASLSMRSTLGIILYF